MRRQIMAMIDFVEDESEASIRRAAEKHGLRVVTQSQFKVMEWGTRQLKIRQLQDECERLMGEIEIPSQA